MYDQSKLHSEAEGSPALGLQWLGCHAKWTKKAISKSDFSKCCCRDFIPHGRDTNYGHCSFCINKSNNYWGLMFLETPLKTESHIHVRCVVDTSCILTQYYSIMSSHLSGKVKILRQISTVNVIRVPAWLCAPSIVVFRVTCKCLLDFIQVLI